MNVLEYNGIRVKISSWIIKKVNARDKNPLLIKEGWLIMNKYSRNVKLNRVLMKIEDSLLEELGIDEVKRYYSQFKHEDDYNIVQYGNLLIWYNEIYDFYRECGYKSTDKMTTDKIWDLYKKQVGYVARCLVG